MPDCPMVIYRVCWSPNLVPIIPFLHALFTPGGCFEQWSQSMGKGNNILSSVPSLLLAWRWVPPLLPSMGLSRDSFLEVGTQTQGGEAITSSFWWQISRSDVGPFSLPSASISVLMERFRLALGLGAFLSLFPWGQLAVRVSPSAQPWDVPMTFREGKEKEGGGSGGKNVGSTHPLLLSQSDEGPGVSHGCHLNTFLIRSFSHFIFLLRKHSLMVQISKCLKRHPRRNLPSTLCCPHPLNPVVLHPTPSRHPCGCPYGLPDWSPGHPWKYKQMQCI